MTTADTDRDWEVFASTDPYWAVLTDDRYRKANLTEQALREFYQTGEAHVAWLLETIARHLDAGFTPRSCLDFGCGVGRVVVPFARRGLCVVGVDVADSMLLEARRRCDALGLADVRLVRSDDGLSLAPGPFDLIHSFIVFQHIPRERGRRLLALLLERLSGGGVGVLHFAYETSPSRPRPRRGALRSTLGFLARAPRRFLRGLRGPSPAPPPVMQMNSYDLNEVLLQLQQNGVSRVWLECTEDRGEHGVTFFFQKPRRNTATCQEK
jgi:SAM-dependent methyltransferase